MDAHHQPPGRPPTPADHGARSAVPGAMPDRAHVHDLAPFRHSHAFGDGSSAAKQRALVGVAVLTIATMAVELAAGYWSGSLALVADGWHMGTHAAAMAGAAAAYHLARRAEGHSHYAFGGWKIEVLAAYSSGLGLLAVAAWLAADSVATLIHPKAIDFRDALIVAVLGLAVNLVSAVLLSRSTSHGHGHGHGQAHDHGHGAVHAHGHAVHRTHHDANFRAAYLHVLADALTSVLAIAALAGGLWWGAGWLDPVVALVGAAVIASWSLGLLRSSARALVDATAGQPLRDAVRAAIESDGDARLADLHVWQVGPRAYAAALSVVADAPLSPDAYRRRLDGVQDLKHATIEVHACRNAPG